MQYEQNVNDIHSTTSVVNINVFSDKVVIKMLYKGNAERAHVLRTCVME